MKQVSEEFARSLTFTEVQLTPVAEYAGGDGELPDAHLLGVGLRLGDLREEVDRCGGLANPIGTVQSVDLAP